MMVQGLSCPGVKKATKWRFTSKYTTAFYVFTSIPKKKEKKENKNEITKRQMPEKRGKK